MLRAASLILLFCVLLNPAEAQNESTVLWSSFLGGPTEETIRDAAVGPDGLVTALLLSYPGGDLTLPIPLPPRPGGTGDILIVRIDPAEPDPTQQVLWARWLGGSGTEFGGALALTPEGGCVVVGRTGSTDFPLVNPFDDTAPVNQGAFITELDAEGSLVWSTFLSGSILGTGLDVEVNDDIVTVVGSTVSSDFPLVNPYDSSINGGEDYFVAQIQRGVAPTLIWSTFFGGSDSEPNSGAKNALAVRSDGLIYLAGHTNSTNLPVTPGAAQTQGSPLGYWKGFICLLDPSATGGSQLISASYLGGAGNERILDLSLDAAGRPIIVGVTTSSDFPTTSGAWIPTIVPPVFSTSGSGFVTVFEEDLSSFAYSSLVGTAASLDIVESVEVSDDGELVLFGYTNSTAFPTTPDAAELSYTGQGNQSAFITVLNPAGQGADDLVYSSFLGGFVPGYVSPRLIEPISPGIFLVAGYCWTTSGTSVLPAEMNAFQQSSTGFDGILSIVTLPFLGDLFVRGDANLDADVNLADAISILSHLFLIAEVGGCEDARDANDSGSTDLSDAVTVINLLFTTGGSLPPPFPACGLDETVDTQGCDDTICP